VVALDASATGVTLFARGVTYSATTVDRLNQEDFDRDAVDDEGPLV
jgi:hypothetical protein